MSNVRHIKAQVTFPSCKTTLDSGGTRALAEIESISFHVAETKINGKWVRVPALDYKGKSIIAKGTWLRLAQILGEEWLETELEDAELCAQLLKSQRRRGLRADIL
ncbi:MAG: hypothetical protein WAQ77_04410, partial [Candidatus Acidiferrum sp.]